MRDNKKFKPTSSVRNTAMRDGLEKLNYKNKNTPLAWSKAITDWEGDGIDHINVSSQGKTSIGQFLAHDSNYEVVSPVFGRFSSVRNLWLWLKSKSRDDRLRTRTGGYSSLIGGRNDQRDVPNFRAIILDTDWNKLKQYDKAANTLACMNLPLDTYFYDSGTSIQLPRRPTTANWLIAGWEELRRALRENREPDLTPFMDVPGSGIYDFAFNNEGVMPAVIAEAQAPVRVKRYQPVGQNNGHKQGNFPRNNRRNPESVKNSFVDLTKENVNSDVTTTSIPMANVHISELPTQDEVKTETEVTAEVMQLTTISTQADTSSTVVTSVVDTNVAVVGELVPMTNQTEDTVEVKTDIRDVIKTVAETTEPSSMGAMAAAFSNLSTK